ncbi:MAG: hypothetical protein ISS11_01920 [Candidatus Marinimicrobia bacterium]|nr:hypothetical protein [Candidatus Neomarinimicrobiota bacterium]
MKNIISTLVVLLLLTGCAELNKIQPPTVDSIVVDYDSSNPVKIEESIVGLNIVEFVNKVVNKDNDLIVLASAEALFTGDHNYYLDTGTRYLIEDNIISSLKIAGYRVGERDPDIMWHLSRESKEKYNLYNLQYKGSDANKSEEAKAPEGATINNYYYGNVDSNTLSKSDASLSEEESGKLVLTDLTAADKILTYRVLECGVIYKNSSSDNNKILRLARTRLHCRLENAKTGEILNAGLVEKEIKDIIPKSKMKELKNIHYKFYDHTLPNIKSQDKLRDVVISSNQKQLTVNQNVGQKESTMWIIAGVAVGGFLLLVGSL